MARERSATGMMVTEALAELFAGTGSDSLNAAPAVSLKVPSVMAVAVMVKVALLLEGSVPRVKVTALPFVLQVPWLVVADTNCTAAGNVSVTTSEVAAHGPAFETVMV